MSWIPRDIPHGAQMRTSWRFSSFCVVSLALLGAGCEPAPSSAPTGSEAALAQRTDRAVGDVKLLCEIPQDGSYFELKQTATGYEGVVATQVYDPWDCRCIYLKREVVGQYSFCHFAASDPRIVSCWRREPNGTAGKMGMFSTKVTRQSLVIGGTGQEEATHQLMDIGVVNQDPGQTPRRDFSYELSDCTAG
ncbi:lipoprotein [Myxococcus stipitatus DSM 14675]|uniref:Lipoprotein n=2 Tax=Myxococcus stipitatus TaxID=83455 RepID=L7UI78_MYXSD|nr:lipoprotein [Myxococcus stipitatus DSM 14675]